MTAPQISMSMLPWREDIPRGGLAREAALVGIANTLLNLNRMEGKPGVTAAPSPVAGAFTYSIAGVKYAGAGATFDLTGLPDVPPFRKCAYLLLVDRTDAPAVWAAVPTELNEPAQRWAPNGPEALIVAMNRGTGYAVVGFLVVVNDAATPWTPGTAFPAAPSTATAYDGFPGDMLLPFSVPPGVPPGLVPR